MRLSSKRAEHLAGATLALSAAFFVISLLIGLWSNFNSVYQVSWFILVDVFIWFVLLLQFHQRSLAEQEKLDTGQIKEKEKGSAIFQSGQEKAAIFAQAQRKLEVLERWFLPVFSALISAYQLGIGIYLVQSIPAAGSTETREPLLCAVVMAAIAFISFLISRYATGMSSQLKWKPLRAGGSFMLATAIICFALTIALALHHFNIFTVLSVINWIIPVALVILGLENGLNVLLDLYRPRLKGQYQRAGFDSRLLGLINEPGGIFRTAATAIDYQFGFKVSQTWFYKLLEKAILPLVLFGGLTLYLMSCIVVIEPNEQAIIERFGNPRTQAGQVRYIEPGITFKLPWPIDIIHKYPVKKVSEICVGFEPGDKEHKEHGPLLWSLTHYHEEDKLLVASHTEQLSSEAVPVSLASVALKVQYRVSDLHSFLYTYGVESTLEEREIYQAEERLRSISYNELTKVAAGSTLEMCKEHTAHRNLFGTGLQKAKDILTENIQKAADEAGLGVEIIFVGVQGIHPPTEVAKDYQRVVGAVQQKQASILDAKAQRIKTLASLAGSVDEVGRLYELAEQYQKAKEQNNPELMGELAGKLDQAFASAKGEIFKKLRTAQSYAFEKSTIAEAVGERFKGQSKAYRAAPEYYTAEQRLKAIERGLENIRKYVILTGYNDTQTTVIDLQEEYTPDVYELIGEQESEK